MIMKKVCFILIVLCMSSCEFAKNEYKLIQEANKCSNETNKCFTCVKEFTYNEHDYIKFSEGYQCGLVHNPDCRKYKVSKE